MAKEYEKRKGGHSPTNRSGYEAVREVTKEVGGTESAAVTSTFNGISRWVNASKRLLLFPLPFCLTFLLQSRRFASSSITLN